MRTRIIELFNKGHWRSAEFQGLGVALFVDSQPRRTKLSRKGATARRRVCGFIIVALVVAIVAFAPQAAAAAVVYDSLSGLNGGGQGFGENQGVLTYTEIGQGVTLAGTERIVTQFELELGSNRNGEFHVRFYNLDGLGDEPDTLIWQSPVQTYPYAPPFFNRKVLSIDVPGIIVPSTFAWVISPVGVISFLIGNADDPTIGLVHERWFRSFTDGTWAGFLSPLRRGAFGARITAIPVPEPSAPALITLGGVALMGRRRLL